MYQQRDYQQLSSQGIPYHDIQTISLGSSAYYIYSPKLDFFVNYEYVISESGSNSTDFINNTVQNYFLGMEGDITPKLTGNLAIGFGTRDYDLNSIGSESACFLMLVCYGIGVIKPNCP